MSKRQLGFSLIEMMLVTGIMAIMALGMANLFQMNLKAQATVAKGYQLENIHEEMRRYLANEKECSNSFQGLDPAVDTVITALKDSAGTASTVYVTNAVLGDRQVQIMKMTLQGVATDPVMYPGYLVSTPLSGVGQFVVEYRKIGDVNGYHDFRRTMKINIVLDPVTFKLKTCQTQSMMTNGLWTRTTFPDPSDASLQNIYYNAGKIGMGTQTPNGVAQIHSPGKQGNLFISGVSDAGKTWSGVYLANGTGDTPTHNRWAMAFKNNDPIDSPDPANPASPDQFILAYQKSAGGVLSSQGPSISMLPPQASVVPARPGPIAMGTLTPDLNETLHVHNSFWQGAMKLSGVGDPGTSSTFSSFSLGDQNGANKAADSHQWAIAYKKSDGAAPDTSVAETLQFVYQTRAAGGWALGASGTNPLTLLGNAGANGRVGVNKNDPKFTLEVAGQMRSSDNIYTSGKLGIGQAVSATSPYGATLTKELEVIGSGKLSGDLDVGGRETIGDSLNVGTTINAGGTITAGSDRRLKKDIQPLASSMLGKIDLLKGVSYLRKNEELNREGREIGFIAQDVEKIFPEFVRENPATGMKGINYGQMVAVLTEGIKELHQKSLQCETENKNLIQRLSEMDARLAKLEKLLNK